MSYISITSLELKSVWQTPRFWWHAIRSFTQAKRTPGNLSVAVARIGRAHCTLSVWTDEAAMRAYLVAGAHRKAMAAFHSIATGTTYGFAGNQAPGWGEVPELLRVYGRPVGRQ